MTDRKHRSVVCGQRRFQRGKAVQIEMVGWFVKDQELGGRCGPEGAGEARAQPVSATKVVSLEQSICRPETKPGKCRMGRLGVGRRIQQR